MKNDEFSEMLRSHAKKLTETMAVPDCFESRKEDNMKNNTFKAKRIVIPAIIAAALGVTALAVTLGWHAKLEEFLKPTETQKQGLETAVNTPKATVTKDGVTVNVLQTLNDSSSIYTLYEVIFPEGTDGVDSEYPVDAFMSCDFEEPTSPGIGMGTSSSKVLSREGNKLTLVMYNYSNSTIKDGKASLDLMRVGNLEGEWSVSWDYKYKDVTKVYEPNVPVDLGNGNNDTLKKVSVSPISVSVEVYGDDVVTALHPVIKFKDGTSITLETINDFNTTVLFTNDVTAGKNNFGTTFISYHFDRICDLQSIESVSAGSAVVEIK